MNISCCYNAMVMLEWEITFQNTRQDAFITIFIENYVRKEGPLRYVGCKWAGGYSEILKSETTSREISKCRRERPEEERGRRKKRAGKWHRATGRERKAGFHAWLPASVGQPRQVSAADDYRPSLSSDSYYVSSPWLCCIAFCCARV